MEPSRNATNFLQLAWMVLLCAAGSTVCCGASYAQADLRYHLFYNGTFWTADDALPVASAMLVRHGIIAAVGSREEVGAKLAQLLARSTHIGATQGDSTHMDSTQVEEQQGASAPAAGGATGGAAAPGHVEQAAAVAGAAAGAGAGAGRGAEEVVMHDLGGAFIIPGFVDPHTHIIPGGLGLSRVDLRGVTSRTDFAARLAVAAAAAAGHSAGGSGGGGASGGAGGADGDWLLGGLWDEGEWGGGLPSTEWLDEPSGGRPVWLTRHDCHLGVASSEALRRAGIDASTPDPEGGTIDRRPDGTPTGILRERAMQLVAAAIPEPSSAARAAALAAASRLALSRGVTSLVDLGRYPFADLEAPWRDLQEVYLPAADAGQLAVRVFAYMPLSSWPRLVDWVASRGPGHPGGRLYWSGGKEFADGSLGSRTALMWEAYSDGGEAETAGAAEQQQRGGAGEEVGTRMLADAELRGRLRGALGAGLQVAVHAIGDRAVDELIATYESVLDDLARQQLAAEAAAAAAAAAASRGRRSPCSRCGDAPPSNASEGAVAADGGNNGEGEQYTGKQGQAGAVPEGLVKARRAALAASSHMTVEHVQHVSGPNVSAALARTRLFPVTNPLHLLTDRHLLLPRLGPHRAAPSRSFPLRSHVAAGALPACGSDWPVVDLQPVTGVYAAVHRTAPSAAAAAAMNAMLPLGQRMRVVGVDARHGGGGGGAAAAAHGSDGAQGGATAAGKEGADGEGLTVADALRCHTSWAAAAAGLAGKVGRLAPGMAADFVQLSDALVPAAPPTAAAAAAPAGKKEQRKAEKAAAAALRERLPVVVRTWLGGELVYELEGWGAGVAIKAGDGAAARAGVAGARAERVRRSKGAAVMEEAAAGEAGTVWAVV